jgi:hypothetical protein
LVATDLKYHLNPSFFDHFKLWSENKNIHNKTTRI